jgi:hypothetical protein
MEVDTELPKEVMIAGEASTTKEGPAEKVVNSASKEVHTARSAAAATDRPTRADGRRVLRAPRIWPEARRTHKGAPRRRWPMTAGARGARRVDAALTVADDGGRTRCAPCQQGPTTAGARGARRVDGGRRRRAHGVRAVSTCVRAPGMWPEARRTHKGAPRRRWPTTADARGARRVDGGRRRRAHGVRAMSTVVDDSSGANEVRAVSTKGALGHGRDGRTTSWASSRARRPRGFRLPSHTGGQRTAWAGSYGRYGAGSRTPKSRSSGARSASWQHGGRRRDG